MSTFHERANPSVKMDCRAASPLNNGRQFQAASCAPSARSRRSPTSGLKP